MELSKRALNTNLGLYQPFDFHLKNASLGWMWCNLAESVRMMMQLEICALSHICWMLKEIPQSKYFLPLIPPLPVCCLAYKMQNTLSNLRCKQMQPVGLKGNSYWLSTSDSPQNAVILLLHSCNVAYVTRCKFLAHFCYSVDLSWIQMSSRFLYLFHILGSQDWSVSHDLWWCGMASGHLMVTNPFACYEFLCLRVHLSACCSRAGTAHSTRIQCLINSP